MPIRHAIWKVGEVPEPLALAVLDSEQMLEEMIVAAPHILSSDWMLIGRQETTDAGGRIDLLAITPGGSLVLIELKRNKTPRDIVAQAIDYASWVEKLTPEKISQMYNRFSSGKNLSESFNLHFGRPLDPESLNSAHEIVVVAGELDASTERIVGYLNDRDVPINVLFFQVFQLGDRRLLSRAWLIDPMETQVNAVQISKEKGEKGGPWNGEYYASFSDDRPWEEARKYGFICGGNGAWYSRTLQMLTPNARVWVNIPQIGYVGVARVIDTVKRADEFQIATPQGTRPALAVLSNGSKLVPNASDPERAEYFVPVQ